MSPRSPERWPGGSIPAPGREVLGEDVARSHRVDVDVALYFVITRLNARADASVVHAGRPQSACAACSEAVKTRSEGFMACVFSAAFGLLWWAGGGCGGVVSQSFAWRLDQECQCFPV